MKYVLFVCNHNAGRSQMAQAFFERYAPPDIRAESAGDAPVAAIWPSVIEAMREVGIEIADRRPKRLDLEMQLHADFAVTLACGAECPYVAADVEEWDIPDPSGRSLEEVRAIRDQIEDKVHEFVATPSRRGARQSDSASATAREAVAVPRREVRRCPHGRGDSRLRRRRAHHLRGGAGALVRPRPRLSRCLRHPGGRGRRTRPLGGMLTVRN
jgi:arsenate reductase